VGAPRRGSRSLEPVPDSASLLAAGSRRCSSERGSEGQSERSELLSVWLMREPGAGEPAAEVTARITAGTATAGTRGPAARAGTAPEARLALRPLAAAGGGSAPGGGFPTRGSGSAGAARATLLGPGAALAPPAALAPAPGGGLSFAPGAPPLRRERRPGAAGGPGEGGALPARLGERGAAGAGARPEEGAAWPGAAGRPCRSLRNGLAGEGARCSRLRSASGWRWWCWRWCWPGGCGFGSWAPPPAGPFSVSMAGARAASSSSGGGCSGRRRRRAASPRARSSLSASPARSAPRAPAPPPAPHPGPEDPCGVRRRPRLSPGRGHQCTRSPGAAAPSLSHPRQATRQARTPARVRRRRWLRAPRSSPCSPPTARPAPRPPGLRPPALRRPVRMSRLLPAGAAVGAGLRSLAAHDLRAPNPLRLGPSCLWGLRGQCGSWRREEEGRRRGEVVVGGGWRRGRQPVCPLRSAPRGAGVEQCPLHRPPHPARPPRASELRPAGAGPKSTFQLGRGPHYFEDWCDHRPPSPAPPCRVRRRTGLHSWHPVASGAPGKSRCPTQLADVSKGTHM